MSSVDLIVKLRDAFQAAAQACQEFLEQMSREWREVKTKTPLNPEDRAIRWLERKLAEIKERHPELSFEFLKNQNGQILGLRYSALDDEVAADVESPTLWAFSKAEQRPASG
ncbi:MAG: hypothetical protein QW175_06705 [Candidatus Bathyarchaeia archaeon]